MTSAWTSLGQRLNTWIRPTDRPATRRDPDRLASPLAGPLAEATALLRSIEDRLARLEARPAEPAPTGLATEVMPMLQTLARRLGRLEEAGRGATATYMGNGLVLVKVAVHGRTMAYLVEGADRLINPWLIISGAYEVGLSNFFARTLRADDRCLDVGANFGYFSCLFGRFCPRGRVIGVEADAPIFALARDNVNINALGSVAALRHAAVCDAERPVTLHRRVGRSGNTSIWKTSPSLLEALGEPPTVEFSVAGTTVDRLVEGFHGRLDILKIDVEGAEPLVFAGATNTIAANPGLQIVMEWSPGQIRHAGLDVGTFLEAIEASGLAIHTLDAAHRRLSRTELLNIPYAAGILLTRQPRQPAAA